MALNKIEGQKDRLEDERQDLDDHIAENKKQSVGMPGVDVSPFQSTQPLNKKGIDASSLMQGVSTQMPPTEMNTSRLNQ